eukprot:s1253_g2.t1
MLTVPAEHGGHDQGSHIKLRSPLARSSGSIPGAHGFGCDRSGHFRRDSESLSGPSSCGPRPARMPRRRGQARGQESSLS